jgi:hypothetical protein
MVPFLLSLAVVICSTGWALAQSQSPAPQTAKVVPATIPSAISPSGQFTIYGGTPVHRGEFLTRCEALSRDVASVTGQGKTQWLHPCVIELTVSDSPQVVQRRASAQVLPLEPNGYRLQLYLLIDEDFKLPEFQQEFIRLLLIERMLATNRPDANPDRLPGWILAGVTELVEYRRAGRPSDVFTALMDAHQIPPVAEVITTSTGDYSDSVSRGIYRACAAALVQALLDQASGPARFQALLEDLAYAKAPIEDLLRTHFPALDQTPEALAKWWTLQLASMSERSAYELLSALETEKLLEQSLLIDLTGITDEAVASAAKSAKKTTTPRTSGTGRLRKLARRVPEPDQGADKATFSSGSLGDFAQFVQDPRAPLALQQCEDRLNKLSARCFPLYRPILSAYGRTVSRLVAGETDGVTEELDALRKRREEISLLMGGVNDYMNWYVTTQVREPSSEFNGYAEALTTLKRLESRRRQDPITSYLDAMERELSP